MSGAPVGPALAAFKAAVWPLRVYRSKGRTGTSSTGAACYQYRIEIKYHGRTENAAVVDGIEGLWKWKAEKFKG